MLILQFKLSERIKIQHGKTTTLITPYRKEQFHIVIKSTIPEIGMQVFKETELSKDGTFEKVFTIGGEVLTLNVWQDPTYGSWKCGITGSKFFDVTRQKSKGRLGYVSVGRK